MPVCFVSARTGAGVRELLDVAETLFPHPGEANPPPFVKGVGANAQPIAASPDPDAHVIADVFKIVNDPFVGKLGVFRVYQGTVRKDTQLFVDDGKKPFKVAHLFKLKGKDHVEVDQAIPGDIAAVAKVDDLHFDAVLHDSHDEDQIHLAPLAFPQPDVRPGGRSRAQGPGTETRHRRCTSWPRKTRRSTSSTTSRLNETVIRGLSDLHLRVMLERLKDRYGVEVHTHPPRIAYRETIGGQGRGPSPAQEADRRRRPVRRGVPAHRTVGARRRLRVRRRGQGRHDPRPVHAGGRERRAPGASGGAVAGYPMQDVRVIVYDGKYHPWIPRKWRSSPPARRRSWMPSPRRARRCWSRSSTWRSPRPSSTWATSAAAWPSKRARINGTDSARGGEIVVKAQVPLSELEGYAAELKSVTAGRGRYHWSSATTSRCRARSSKKLVEAYKPHHEDD